MRLTVSFVRTSMPVPQKKTQGTKGTFPPLFFLCLVHNEHSLPREKMSASRDKRGAW